MTDLPPRTYPHGVPSWIDLETRDATAIAPFYEAVLGWTLTDAMPPQAPGHYLIATIDGQDVGAIASGVAAIGAGTAWSTYLAVDDADASAAAVEAAGGTVTSPPADTPGGRPVACLDREGAPFRLWQAGRRLGAQHVNAAGGWNFSNLHTADAHAAFAFYAAFLPWRWDDSAAGFIRVPGYGAHLAATSDPGIHERQRYSPPGFDDAIGGFEPLQAGERAHWQVSFSVADRDAAVAAVEAAGGTVASTGEDEWTRHAVVVDPAGARFTLSQFAPRSW
ncbi:VOC family protein [uncultured Amnibacterium sp.]|uniref:VOC family protein n=1 Tax=uncultured Amnibacterium sp. TaxID=1631851 RepID=UPI0035CB7E01